MQRNMFALFGVVAVLLTATVALTVSRATLTVGGVGNLTQSGHERLEITPSKLISMPILPVANPSIPDLSFFWASVIH
jgi:hypothetical protein